MTEREADAITARVFATPAGKVWLAWLRGRSDAPITFLIADIDMRVRRERERWRTGELTPP